MNLDTSSKPSNSIENIRFAPSLIKTNEKDALKKMNWHGMSLKFSSHNIDRQFKDLSLFKSSKLSAIKAAKDYEILKQKKQLQEYDYARQLLAYKKKQESAKNQRLATLLENNNSLVQRMNSAATFIQKIVRGCFIRKKYKEILNELAMKRLSNKIENLEGVVDSYLKYMGASGYKAVVTLQKNVRKFLCVRKFIRAKEKAYEMRANLRLNKVITIQAHIRGYLARKKLKKIREEKIIKSSLERIRKRLLVLRLKEFWHRKKFIFEVIQKKYREKSENSDKDQEKEKDNPEKAHENYEAFFIDVPKLYSKMNTISENYKAESQRSSLLFKDFTVPLNDYLIEKPPRPPRPMTRKYLLPTMTYINRIAQDPEETKTTKASKQKRSISGRRFQKNTQSRATYIKELNKTTKKIRASSADYKKNRMASSRNTSHVIEKKTEKFPQVITPACVVDFLKSLKNRSPTPNLLLQKVEDFPSPIFEEAVEKVYVYNAPKPQSLSFKDALPNVNYLLETYGRNLKTKK